MSTLLFDIHVVTADGHKHHLPRCLFTNIATAFAWTAARWPDAQRVHICTVRPAPSGGAAPSEPDPQPRAKTTLGLVGLKSPAQPQPAPKPVNDPSGVSRLRRRDSRARAPVCIERVSRTSWLARLGRTLGRSLRGNLHWGA